MLNEGKFVKGGLNERPKGERPPAPPAQSIKSIYELRQESTEQIKEIIKGMNGLSEEGFINKFNNDPYFRRGFDVLVGLYIEAKFNI